MPDAMRTLVGTWREFGNKNKSASWLARADELEQALVQQRKLILDAIPTNWLDPLLTGPEAVVGQSLTNKDIERLTLAIRKRVEELMPLPAPPEET